jgi:hypothetical protein
MEKAAMDMTARARLAALWMAQGATLAKLLRGHGQEAHAGALEAALTEVARILARGVDAPTLAGAVDWITEQAWEKPTTEGSALPN